MNDPTNTPNDTPPRPDPAPLDERFTAGLLVDVLAVLDAHGYRPPDGRAGDRAHGAAMMALGQLVRAYEGRDR